MALTPDRIILEQTPMPETQPALLFSYGTLRQRDVQREVFRRELDGHPDEIAGYELDTLVITDPAVIATSGSDRHPILRRSGAQAWVYVPATRD